MFLAYTLHEAGHITAAYLCAMPVECVSFSSLGVRISGRSEGISYLRRAAVSLAGPLANLLFFLCLSQYFFLLFTLLFLIYFFCHDISPLARANSSGNLATAEFSFGSATGLSSLILAFPDAASFNLSTAIL